VNLQKDYQAQGHRGAEAQRLNGAGAQGLSGVEAKNHRFSVVPL
jgi:hypothetical protein